MGNYRKQVFIRIRMTRQELQAEFCKCIIDNKYSGVFVSSPRSGKTKATLDALTPIQHLNILIVVPFNTVRKSWEEEIIKWKYKGNLQIILRNSLHTINLDEFHLIVKDECHLISEKEFEILAKANKPICAITGTLGKQARLKLQYRLGLKEKFRYDVEDAVEDKIISDFTLNLHYCYLDTKEKSIDINGELFTEQQAYDKFTNKIHYFEQQGNLNLKLLYSGKRARLIYSSTDKIEKCKALISKKKRVLVFTALTNVANYLCKKAFHSKSSNPEILEDFKSGKINKLGVVNTINMGVTILNLKEAIVHQFNSKEETAVQRILRVMNLEGNKKATINVFCVKNTVDEKWIQSALAFMDSTKINYM